MGAGEPRSGCALPDVSKELFSEESPPGPFLAVALERSIDDKTLTEFAPIVTDLSAQDQCRVSKFADEESR